MPRDAARSKNCKCGTVRTCSLTGDYRWIIENKEVGGWAVHYRVRNKANQPQGSLRRMAHVFLKPKQKHGQLHGIGHVEKVRMSTV